MSVRRSLILLTLLMIALPLIVFSQNARQQARQTEAAVEQLADLETYAVTPGRVEAIVSALGTLAADRVVSLDFRTAGRVESLWVQVGDFMFAGEALAQLDNTNQQIGYEQAQLALDRADLELADLMGPVPEEDLQLAQASIDSALGQYLSIANAVTSDDIRAAELAYEQALVVYNDIKSQRDQAVGGFGSDNYINLDAQTGAASFNAEIARLQLEDLRNGTAPQAGAAFTLVQQARAEYDRVAAGPTRFEIDGAALRVRQSDAQLRRAETTLNRTTLNAPFDGVITAVTTEVGGLVAPGFPVVEMADLSPLRLTVQVDEIDIRLISEGLSARVTLDALPDVEIPASISRIALVGTNQGGIVSYGVELTLDEAATDPRARVGMTAEASIIIDQRDDVLIVPNFYVRRDGDRAFVELLRPDDTLEEVEVVLGLQGRDFSEVLSGLDAGDVIAINFSEERFSIFGG